MKWMSLHCTKKYLIYRWIYWVMLSNNFSFFLFLLRLTIYDDKLTILNEDAVIILKRFNYFRRRFNQHCSTIQHTIYVSILFINCFLYKILFFDYRFVKNLRRTRCYTCFNSSNYSRNNHFFHLTSRAHFL